MLSIFPNYELANNKYVPNVINSLMFTWFENLNTELKSGLSTLSIKINRIETLKKLYNKLHKAHYVNKLNGPLNKLKPYCQVHWLRKLSNHLI
jgi:hypothetical protein